MDELANALTGPREDEPHAFDEIEEGYEAWLRKNFPFVASKPLSPRHRRLWEWFERLTPGTKPRAKVEPWPRGGAKSTTGQLGVVYVGCRLTRRFALIVSETQDQADLLVQSIASLFERIGIERSLSKYGYSKGWSAQRLRTANGFNVMGLGLDGAVRGIKFDELRPDLILLDDFDNQHDTPRAVAKKVKTITASILPAGSIDSAVLFLQNLIHEGSIMTSLVRGNADFLHQRESAIVEPAVRGLETERVEMPDGSREYRIVGGEATWEGQDLATAEAQINEWGLPTFLRESQHEVEGADGLFFDVEALRYCDHEDIPADLKLARGWDLGATQGGGDPTVGALLGKVIGSPTVYVIDVKREFYETNAVKGLESRTADADDSQTVYDEDEKGSQGRFVREGQPRFTFPKPHGSVTQRFPQDPGQAGKAQAADIRADLGSTLVKTQTVRGKKSKRHARWQAKFNSGNVILVRGPWVKAFVDEHRLYREDEEHEHDDQADAASDAYDVIDPAPIKTTPKHVPNRIPFADRSRGLNRRP